MRLADAERLAVACPSDGGSNGCVTCRLMCEHGYPGRFTPTEAQRVMDAGHADRLLRVRNFDSAVLRPAIIGWEGGDITEYIMALGQCTFMTVTGGCELHGTGMKPLECRVAPCGGTGANLSNKKADAIALAIERAWDTRAGIAAMVRWRALNE